MQFYDMHSHLLPEFDDGAKSADESLALLDCLKKQNVTNVCFTPHFYTNEKSMDDFVAQRNQKFEEFKPLIPEDFNIVLGAEVYVTKYLFTNDDLSELTYGNSKYILTEFAYNSSFSDKTMDCFVRLIDNYGLIPVMPHVERYDTLISNPNIIAELKAMGVVIQTNISSYTKKSSIFKRRKMLKLIRDGLIDILGSDAHSMTHNSPELYREAVACISEKCGQQAVEKMMNNAQKIFDAAI
jgi:protein-tyrosine phosphatase